MLRFYSLVFIVLFSNMLYSQNSEFGIGVGQSKYYGDLSSSGDFKNTIHPAFQLYYNYYFNKYLITRISLAHGKISGDDKYSTQQWQQERNLSFESSIIEGSIVAQLHVLGSDKFISPFFYGGFNVFHFNPKTLYKGEWVYLQPLGTEGQGSELHPEKIKYSLYDVSMVMGAGIKIRINSRFSLSFELGWRKCSTDYIDDISTNYVNYAEIKRTNGTLAAELSDRTPEYLGIENPLTRETGAIRGNPDNKDYYVMSFTNFVYKFNSDKTIKLSKKVKCPRF
ncbi:MAG: DUF6089 family protein [Saprospiraceae bacterium]